MSEVYIKGVCINNGFPDARAGYGIYWGPQHADNKSEMLVSNPKRLEKAELQAAIVAIDQAKKRGVRNLTINTECDYVVKTAENLVEFKQMGVCNGNGDDLEMLAKASQGITAEFKKDKTGVRGNDEAWRLARESLKE